MAKNKIFSASQLIELPKELVQHILLKVPDVKDVLNLLQSNKKLHIVYNDQNFWKAMCKQHYPFLKTAEKEDFRALFIDTFQQMQPIKRFIDKVKSVTDEIFAKSEPVQNPVYKLLMELKTEHEKILVKGETMTLNYYYLLTELKDSLKDQKYKAEQKKLNELMNGFSKNVSKYKTTY